MKILDPHKYFLVILHILQFLNQIKDVYILSLARYLSWILKIMKRNIKSEEKIELCRKSPIGMSVRFLLEILVQEI